MTPHVVLLSEYEKCERERDDARAEVKRLREQHERDLIHVREAHEARRMAEAETERLRQAVEGLQRAAESDRLRIEQLRAALRDAVSWTYGEDVTPERRDEVEGLLR